MFASDTDTSLLSKQKTVAAPDFTVKNFGSCDDMRTKVADFMELYYETHPSNYYPYMSGPRVFMDKAVTNSIPPAGAVAAPEASASSTDHSTTNTRTIGVDEPERVKTDGKYLYSANITEHMVYIHRADDSLALIKKIALPDEYSSPQLFIDGTRLVIISDMYSGNNYGKNAWIDRSSKTVVAVYNLADINSPVIDRYFQIDGGYREARLVDGQLSLITTTGFSFPYDRYIRPQVNGTTLKLDTTKIVSEFATANVLPKKIDVMPASKITNLPDYLAKTKRSLRLRENFVTNCANTSYVLPDAKTLESYNFTPSFTSVTTFDIRNKTKKSITKLFFGDVDKTYLSGAGNLYLSSTLYSPYSWSCPPGAMCMMRMMPTGSNTILHKFELSKLGAQYRKTALINGSLFSDYAIDEASDGSVRIVTHTTGSEPDNMLSVLTPTLAPLASLTGIAPKETFQSARYIGNKLYLVTFERIDPLFVIDLADAKNPKILGELKIPGYSTYLHPYDETHLIGIGYDTKTNEWGGTQNNGVKIDLYDISDLKNPKQQSTLTLGANTSSYSEALSNPRLFVWQKSRNLLYLPVSLYKSPADKPYQYTDVFQGVVAVSVNTKTGVTEKARTTQLDTLDNATLEATRAKECMTYTTPKTPVCRKLIGEGEYCEPAGGYTYIPSYCYADSPISEYLATQIWSYSNNFIDRVVYSGNRLFTFSNTRIDALDIDDGLRKMGSVQLSSSTKSKITPIAPMGDTIQK